MENDEIDNEIDAINKWEEKIKGGDLKCEVDKCKFDFQQYETIRSFGETIRSFGESKIYMDEAKMDQTNMLENMVNFNNKSRPKNKDGKKKNTFHSVRAVQVGRKLTLNAFKSEIFPIKATLGKARPSDLVTRLK